MGANFRGKFEKALKLIFVVLNFVTANNTGVWHCTSVIDTSARSSLLLSHAYLQRLG